MQPFVKSSRLGLRRHRYTFMESQVFGIESGQPSHHFKRLCPGVIALRTYAFVNVV